MNYLLPFISLFSFVNQPFTHVNDRMALLVGDKNMLEDEQFKKNLYEKAAVNWSHNTVYMRKELIWRKGLLLCTLVNIII